MEWNGTEQNRMERNRIGIGVVQLEKIYKDHWVQLPDHFRTDQNLKYTIEGISQMSLERWWAWGTNHLTRRLFQCLITLTVKKSPHFWPDGHASQIQVPSFWAALHQCTPLHVWHCSMPAAAPGIELHAVGDYSIWCLQLGCRYWGQHISSSPLMHSHASFPYSGGEKNPWGQLSFSWKVLSSFELVPGWETAAMWNKRSLAKRQLCISHPDQTIEDACCLVRFY